MSHVGRCPPPPEKRPTCGAFTDHQNGLPFEGGPRTGEDDVTHPTSPLFGDLELAVIAVARCDPVTRNMGPKVRAIAWLFGITRPNALADPRLETLRLLVIALRRRDRHPAAEVTAALARGFSRNQIDWLSRSVEK